MAAIKKFNYFLFSFKIIPSTLHELEVGAHRAPYLLDKHIAVSYTATVHGLTIANYWWHCHLLRVNCKFDFLPIGHTLPWCPWPIGWIAKVGSERIRLSTVWCRQSRIETFNPDVESWLGFPVSNVVRAQLTRTGLLPCRLAELRSPWCLCSARWRGAEPVLAVRRRGGEEEGGLVCSSARLSRLKVTPPDGGLAALLTVC